MKGNGACVSRRITNAASNLEEVHKVFSAVAKVNVEINKMVDF